MTATSHPADPGAWVWDPRGWEMGGEESVQDARERTRGAARARYASETGLPFTEVRVWKRWGRWMTDQEIWDDEGFEDDTPPDGWVPAFEAPCWTFTSPTHPDAVPIWICTPIGHEPPWGGT